jgi:hypothetical protein
MGFLVTFTFGFLLWVVIWSLTGKGFDAFLLFLLVIIIGLAGRIVRPLMPGVREERE